MILVLLVLRARLVLMVLIARSLARRGRWVRLVLRVWVSNMRVRRRGLRFRPSLTRLRVMRTRCPVTRQVRRHDLTVLLPRLVT